MEWAATAVRVEEYLRSRDGVIDVRVDSRARTFCVRFDTDRVGPRDFIEELQVRFLPFSLVFIPSVRHLLYSKLE